MNPQEIKKQFRVLLSSAIELKEKFDKNESLEIIQAKFEVFLRDMDYLKKLLPDEVVEKGSLLRHIGWIEKWLSKKEPDKCYSDIASICSQDIFEVEDYYYSTSENEISNPKAKIIKKQLSLLKERDCDATAWITTTERHLRKIFPNDMFNLRRMRIISERFDFSGAEKQRYESLLNGLISELEIESNPMQGEDKWNAIHPAITRISKSRFETEHYGDAVEAAFKELNDLIKKAYKLKTTKEEDGDALMRKAFSVSANNPVFKFADISTETGRNIQQGYMDIFAGSMKGIRNPKAHSNLDVHPEEAWEMIVLASHLMRMWEKTKEN